VRYGFSFDRKNTKTINFGKLFSQKMRENFYFLRKTRQMSRKVMPGKPQTLTRAQPMLRAAVGAYGIRPYKWRKTENSHSFQNTAKITFDAGKTT